MVIDLFTKFLLVSATTSLLVIALTVCTPVLRKHFTAKWIYWIWGLLAIRLLLPFNPSWGNGLIDIQLPESPMIQAAIQSVSQANTQVESSIVGQPAQTAVESATHAPSLLNILAIIWLAGAVLFVVYHVAGYYTFRKQALRWSRPIESAQVALQIKSMKIEMGVPASLPVLISEKVPNPMLVGFTKPLLFLPHELYSEEELDFILKHELVHYKRRDMVYKLLLLTVQALHWFNPFVWLLVREASREMELYCDETVVSKQSLAYRKAYCEAILSAMQKPSPRFFALSIHFSGGKQTMKQRFTSILSLKKKRNGLTVFCAVVLALGLLAACSTNVTNGSAAIKPGTIYSVDSSGEQVIVHDAGNSYSIDEEGHVLISYRNGEVAAQAPIQLDLSRAVWDRGISSGGFFISEDKTAIVYNPEPGTPSPLHVLTSDDMGKTWNDTIVQGATGDELFIGFTSKTDGWMTSGASRGVGNALNQVYQTADGGKTWKEIGNPNDVYSEHLTGVGFSNKEIGFMGFRYYIDAGPEIYWTQDQGESWEKLVIELPEQFDADYNKTPLSPIFIGKEGLYPILLTNREDGEAAGTIYLSSKDGGRTWAYDEKLDKM